MSSSSGIDQGRDATFDESLIGEIAYKKWVKAGRPLNDFDQFWKEAEEEVARQGAGLSSFRDTLPPKG